jgi:glycerol-3-phosphate O-acyltransferase
MRGVRRDLYFVPVSIHYGRVVEEDAYRRELEGAEKQPESLRGLLQARRVLRRRHGTVYVSFAEPISLAESLGERRQFFGAGGEDVEEEKRRFIRKFGLRLLREINRASVVGATSVSATVLLSAEGDACRNDDFVARGRALVSFLRRRGVRLTASLKRNDSDQFRESLHFLENGGLIKRLSGMGGEVVYVPESQRLALDFYKNNAIHYFLQAALLVDAVRRGKNGETADADVQWWLDLLRWEFPLPDRGAIASELGDLRAVLHREHVLVGDGDELAQEHALLPTLLSVLDTFREAYWVVARVVREIPEGGLGRKALLEKIHQHHATGLLLDELRRPEGNSEAIFSNALKRFAEVGAIEIGTGRDPLVTPGPARAELEHVERAIVDSLQGHPVPHLG